MPGLRNNKSHCWNKRKIIYSPDGQYTFNTIDLLSRYANGLKRADLFSGAFMFVSFIVQKKNGMLKILI